MFPLLENSSRALKSALSVICSPVLFVAAPNKQNNLRLTLLTTRYDVDARLCVALYFLCAFDGLASVYSENRIFLSHGTALLPEKATAADTSDALHWYLT
jgi:hypothetical protein